MAVVNDGVKGFTSGAAVVRYRCVKFSSGKMIHCTAAEDDVVGYSVTDASATDKPLSVLLSNAAGSFKLTAGAAITAGAMCMMTTAGKVITQTGTNRRLVQALEAAAADGDVIECKVPNFRNTTPS